MKLEAESSTAIFQGTPVRFEFLWDVLKAKNGNLVPAYHPGARSGWPQMALTFRVTNVYKGNISGQARVITGLGGGDCGASARFFPGVSYLVYASGANISDLHVGLCSPGGWIGDDHVRTELQYLMHQRPSKEALLLRPPLWKLSSAAEKLRQQAAEENEKRLATLTGIICGQVIAADKQNGGVGSISFLSALGFSPIDHPNTSVNEDGSFCSQRLGPGKYYLFFTRSDFQGKPVALYYPGVNDKRDATPIDVVAGQTSKIQLNFPSQKTYSVHCVISTNEKPQLSGSAVQISLMNVDGTLWYRESVDFEGFWPLPKTKYFTFDDVPPGHYIAFASVMGRGWLTKKVDLDVVSHSKLISLDIVHKN